MSICVIILIRIEMRFSMQKILIEIKNQYLEFFNVTSKARISNDLLNTNIISNNKLLFSKDYILENIKMVSSFIKEITIDKNIETIYLNDLSMISLVCQLINKCQIKTIISLEEKNFTYEAYETISKVPSIKKVNCYSIPTFMIELFDQKNIIVESRSEILFTSKFMQENNLNQYSKIYYKIALRLTSPLSPTDLADFLIFLKINKYLKTIHFNTLNINDLKSIIGILIKERVKNIRLVIHSNGIDKETALTLKKYNQNLKKYHLVIKLSYSNEYIKENYLKQVIITTITYCFIIIICLSCMAISYVLINNKASEANVAKINERINTVIESSKNNTPTSSEETKEEPNDNLESPIKNKELESLLKINSDTVGWLTVPNTNIDYPVVKTTDNDYYLDHNYEKKYDYNGWVFMHYYNSTHNLDKNTIIFAHNRFYSGIMFGTLNEVTKDTWYNNTKENLITFNTLYDNMQFEVFSIYKTNITADYLKTTFDSDLEWNNFIKMIRERSMFQNNINVGTNDKIITLSTCLDNDTRLVVHAVLRKI